MKIHLEFDSLAEHDAYVARVGTPPQAFHPTAPSPASAEPAKPSRAKSAPTPAPAPQPETPEAKNVEVATSGDKAAGDTSKAGTTANSSAPPSTSGFTAARDACTAATRVLGQPAVKAIITGFGKERLGDYDESVMPQIIAALEKAVKEKQPG